MKQIIRDLLILFLLISFIIFLWFSKGLLFAGGEEGIPFYDLNKTVKFVSFPWQDISAGYSNQLVLNRIPYFSFLNIFYQFGFPNFLVQALHFFIIMSFGTISIYFLLYQTLFKELDIKNNNLFKLVPLLGAIFYLLNPFSMTQIWGRGLYMQFFPFALFPFFLLMFILGLKNKNYIFGLLGLLASFFLAGAYGNPSYIFSQWVIILIYLLFYILKNKKRQEIFFSLFYFFSLFFGWVLVHMWWINIFIKTSSNQFSAQLNSTIENLDAFRGISKDYQLPSLLRLIHEGYFYRDQKYGGSYPSALFMFISWIIPLTLLFSIQSFKKKKYFLFFSILFLFSLFICSGGNFPSGWLFFFIVKTFPVFQVFRNPFEKFGVVLTIAYAPFFAIGAIALSNKIARLFKKTSLSFIILSFMMVLFFGIFLWPIWTGQFAGGLKFNPWVKVPDYYKSLDNWLNEQKDDGRIIHFPINGGDGLKYSGWEYSYQGIEPGEYLFDRPSIGKNGQSFKLYYKFLLDRFNKFTPQTLGPDPDFSNSEFKSEYLYEELAKLNVRYIILHLDIDPNLGNFGEAKPVADYLKTQENINKISSFGKLDIYKVDIPENIHLIYSPQIDLNYSKINPTLYNVVVKNAEKEFDAYFLENFDPNWEFYINGQKIESHERLFSYANKWKIKKLGTFNATIKYKPQDYVSEGMKVSKSTILALILITLTYFMWKIWRLRKI